MGWRWEPGVSVRLLSYTADGDRLVAVSSKVSLSRKSVEELLSMPEGEVELWIMETFRRMHFSPWEHSVYTFLVDGLSRVASHQLVRHRVASYTQLSHRYSEGYLRRMALEACKLTGLECPSRPVEAEGGRRGGYEAYARALGEALGLGDGELVRLAWLGYVLPPAPEHRLLDYAYEYLRATQRYYMLLAGGARREDARYLLPNALRTRIVVTMNARELIQVFLPLRTCTRAQWEIRYIAWSLWSQLVKVHPRLFRWAGPSCVFRENTLRQKPAPLEDYLEGRENFTQPRCPELVERKAIPACLKAARNIGAGEGGGSPE
ncbi:MAG: FAD-dependent thymidylate synthase [Desulfurococcales archaeon]|nr:FAD-dependent thymidylate synthase [Desulfurococcales archaeon]